ncbi:MAG: hypothetical protein O3B21_14265 [Proteobacteria bacterium]|nr:hypothetical protein [Pseudomonadota bacterium]MDA1355885.1 hypothetical protein [Pseudomonadota bacterium]
MDGSQIRPSGGALKYRPDKHILAFSIKRLERLNIQLPILFLANFYAILARCGIARGILSSHPRPNAHLMAVNTRQQQIIGTGHMRVDSTLDVFARRNHDDICDLVRSGCGRQNAATNNETGKPQKKEDYLWHLKSI